MEAQFWTPTVRRDGNYLDVYSSMLQDGIIFVNAKVDQRISGLIASSLLHLSAHGPKDSSVKLYLNTKSGDIVSAMAVVDIVELYKARNIEMQTLGFGELGVSAGLIVAAGTPKLRKMAAHSQLSLYIGIENFELANVKSQEMAARQGEKIKTRFIELLAKYSGQSIDYFRTRTNSEEYLSAEEAQRCGLVDELI